MKNYFRLFPVLFLLCIFCFSCQKSDELIVDQKESTLVQTPEFQEAYEGEEVDCKGSLFIPLTEDQSKILEEIGMEAFWKKYDLENCKEYYQYTVGDYFCNYEVTKIDKVGAGGLAVGAKFCVSCPSFCVGSGIVWNYNGYRATATLDQVSSICYSCKSGVFLPTRNPPN